jgi:membrane-associated phospholipid phosphatase
MDVQLLLWIQENIRTPFLNVFFVAVTTLGNAGMIWIAVSAMLLIPRKTRNVGIMCFIALGLSFVVNNLILKNTVARVRPFNACSSLIPLVPKPTDFSFPSGHSGASFACATVLYKKLQHRYGIPAVILAAMIALSRLYVGVHYPTDVLAGILIGIAAGAAAVKIYSAAEEKRKKKEAA